MKNKEVQDYFCINLSTDNAENSTDDANTSDSESNTTDTNDAQEQANPVEGKKIMMTISFTSSGFSFKPQKVEKKA